LPLEPTAEERHRRQAMALKESHVLHQTRGYFVLFVGGDIVGVMMAVLVLAVFSRKKKKQKSEQKDG
jgi:hypothetical protein